MTLQFQYILYISIQYKNKFDHLSHITNDHITNIL